MLRTPCTERFDHIAQTVSLGGQTVFHSGRHHREALPMHDAICFQLAHLLGQAALRHAAAPSRQLVEAQRLAEQVVDDQPRPLADNLFERRLDRAPLAAIVALEPPRAAPCCQLGL